MATIPVYDNASYDLSTEIGKMRMMLRDVAILNTNAGAKPDGALFADDELQVFIDLAGTWQRAVTLALRALANLYARQALSREIEGHKEDMSKISAALHESAKQWDAQLDKLEASAETAAAGAVSWAECFGFDDESPKIFGMNQYGAGLG